MKKFLLFNLLFAMLFSFPVLAQEYDVDDDDEQPEEFMIPINYIVTQEIVKTKKPIKYADVKEDDILWSTTIMRLIDCREKINYPLYYPTIELDYRKSLVQSLVEGIKKGRIQAYDPNNDEFKTKLTPEEVIAKFDAGDRIIKQQKIDGTGDTTIIIKNQINWGEVRQFLLKEVWFFDRHRSTLDVRIIGVCPIRIFRKNIQTIDDEEFTGEEMRSKLFWVYFPEARRVLANTICYAGKNNQANISFDDLMHKRRFTSHIVSESNSLNDRPITEYTGNGIEAIMESERIKTQMLRMESDFWEY